MADHTIWTSPAAFSSEADFRSWAGGISTALGVVGFVLVDSTAGTGGIDWSSTAITSGLSPSFGAYSGSPTSREIAWEIWRFPTNGEKTGGIGGTSPVYLRFSYGQIGTAAAPLFTMTMSTGYTGSGGVLSSPVLTQTSLISTSVSSPAIANNWMASDGNGVVMALQYSNPSPAAKYVIVIDRQRSMTGVPVVAASGPRAGWSTGISVFRLSASYGTIIGNYDLIEGVASTVSAGPPCLTRGGFSPTGGPYLNTAGETQLYPWVGVTKSGTGVSKMIASYATVDLGGLGTEQPFRWLPHDSATRTMKLLSSAVPGTYDNEGSTVGGLSLATWWSD